MAEGKQPPVKDVDRPYLDRFDVKQQISTLNCYLWWVNEVIS